jgi:hypothetical protein
MADASSDAQLAPVPANTVPADTVPANTGAGVFAGISPARPLWPHQERALRAFAADQAAGDRSTYLVVGGGGGGARGRALGGARLGGARLGGARVGGARVGGGIAREPGAGPESGLGRGDGVLRVRQRFELEHGAGFRRRAGLGVRLFLGDRGEPGDQIGVGDGGEPGDGGGLGDLGEPRDGGGVGDRGGLGHWLGLGRRRGFRKWAGLSD